MQTFTIKDIENLTTIKAHTLRIWEQRYGLFIPKRKESLHRFYDNEDLKKLLRISYLYHSGWKISKIANLSEAEILQKVREANIIDGNFASYINRLIEAGLDFDEKSFIEVLNEVMERIGFERCIVQVCYPFLRKIGLLWSTNNVIPAQEHFASYIIQNRIIVETEKLSAPLVDPEIILVCPQGEFHELPLLFINYLMRKKGWGTIYMGVNIKRNELQQLVQVSGIRYIYLHLITNFTGSDADDYFEEICKAFPDKKIMASGEGINVIQRTFTNLTLLKSDQQIYDFINRVSE
jgi:DNA-binding transcriptional MerR regulator